MPPDIIPLPCRMDALSGSRHVRAGLSEAIMDTQEFLADCLRLEVNAGPRLL